MNSKYVLAVSLQYHSIISPLFFPDSGNIFGNSGIKWGVSGIKSVFRMNDRGRSGIVPFIDTTLFCFSKHVCFEGVSGNNFQKRFESFF